MTVAFTTRTGDGTVTVVGRESLVFVDPDTFQPAAVPDGIPAQLGGESD
jgi:acyl-CoA thioesterase FadM